MPEVSECIASQDMGASLSEFWRELYSELSTKIRAQIFKSFFSDLAPLKLESNKLFILSKDPRVTRHLNHRYSSLMSQCASRIWGNSITVLVQNTSFRLSDPSSEPIRRAKSCGTPAKNHEQIGLNSNYTFERFVYGPSNQNAFIACKASADQPQNYHNPIFMFGNVGLGKTHLLMAVGNHVRASYPWLKIKYVSAEAFQTGVIESYKNRSISTFRLAHRDADIFLFDDIQLITSGAERTQEELFNTFNYLYQNKKQIIISSDRPAQRLSALKDRLVSRFQSGLIVDIKPPDLSTRMKIIQKKSEEMGLSLGQDVMEYLANHIIAQVRLIEACLIRLDFFSQTHEIEITLEMAEKALEDMPLDRSQTEIKIENVLTALTRFFQIESKELKGRSQSSHVSLARHIGMYLIRSLFPDISLSYIASVFGRSDHTTVIYAEKKVRGMLERDMSLKKQIERIQSLI